jgi:glycosyltransferase involved in cell wall biosynthesis
MPLKILMVIPVFYPALDYGGPIPVALNSARHLVSRGHDVTVWTTNLVSSKGEKLSKRTEIWDVEGIRTVYLNSVLRYRWTGVAPDVLRYVREELVGYDVIHIYGFREFLTVVVALWARAIGKPYVLQTLGTIPRVTRSRIKKLAFDTLFGHFILRGAEAVIAKTPADRQPYLDAGISGEKVNLIPNGIDLPPELQSLRGGEFRRRYGVGESEPLFLFVGRIHPVKGADLLVRAFARMGGRGKLAVVGPDEGYRGDLERFVERRGIRGSVIFTGPLYNEEKWAAFNDADVYVLSSMHENFGNTVLESIVCGTPVIVTDRCGIAPYIEGRAGLVVPYEEEALSQAMERLYKDTELREGFSDAGRCLLEEEFSWEPIVEKLEALYGAVISSTRKSG